jgi:hypothetical protein
MKLKLGGLPPKAYRFNGPYKPQNMDSIRNMSGIYLILDQRKNSYFIVYADEAKNMKNDIENNTIKSEWKKYRQGILKVAVYYSRNKEDCSHILKNIIEYFKPPCNHLEFSFQ